MGIKEQKPKQESRQKTEVKIFAHEQNFCSQEGTFWYNILCHKNIIQKGRSCEQNILWRYRSILRRDAIPSRKTKKTETSSSSGKNSPGQKIHRRPSERGASKAGEMDTIVSGRSGKGGLLVLVDRCSRKYLIEHINYISQDEVLSALRKMRRRNAFEIVRSVTTDNGCEFLDQKRLDRFFKAQTYYTRAYAAWEKGSVENANRIVRRFYPKGTNFNLLTRGQILQLENFINSIHRQSLNGETANDYHSRLAKAV